MGRDTIDGAVDAPVRELLAAIAGPAARDLPDLSAIGAALASFALDTDYLARWVARIGPDGGGGLAIHAPERGPRLLLVHRPEGGMGPVHDHRVWVALATISGLETHRRYRRHPDDDAAPPALAATDELAAGEVVTMLPPDDIHDHGHLPGRGRPAFILVMTGDDQRRFARNEWDLETGRHRALVPGEGGRFLATDPWPGTPGG